VLRGIADSAEMDGLDGVISEGANINVFAEACSLGLLRARRTRPVKATLPM
jgi:hypothetical protein